MPGCRPRTNQKPGHIANRLCFALYQEAVALVAEGVATVEDVDKVLHPSTTTLVLPP